MWSQVMARVFRDEEDTNDASSSSVVVQDAGASAADTSREGVSMGVEQG